MNDAPEVEEVKPPPVTRQDMEQEWDTGAATTIAYLQSPQVKLIASHPQSKIIMTKPPQLEITRNTQN